MHIETVIKTADMLSGDLIIRESGEDRSLYFICEKLPDLWNEPQVICNIYHFKIGETAPREVYLYETNRLYPDNKRLLSRVANND